MSYKLLKKVLPDLSSCPMSELEALIKAELAESDMLKALCDSLSDGHIVTGYDGVILFCNYTIYNYISLSTKKRNLEGLVSYKVIKDKDIKKFISDVINGKEKPDPKDFTIQYGQEMRTIRVFFAILATKDNENLIDIVFRDITEDIRNQARLRRSESLASMTTMVAGIAHDIKNPLAAMKIHIQLMEKALQKRGSMDKETAEKYLSVIEEETDHLNSIVVDFLFAVKPMNTELKLSSINEVVEELVSFLLPEAEERKIKVETSYQEFLPRVNLDSKYVRQALLNLVQNAFAAMPDGGELNISTRLDGDYILLSIKDSGIGISDEKLSRIFEPYYTTKATGTGLGLTTVYKVMKEHGGDIHVTSEVGKGTCFVLQFPVPSSQRAALEDKK